MPITVMAQPITGLYVGAGGGLNAPQDPRVTNYGNGFPAGRATLKEGYGYNAELAIGYGIGNGFRFEIEGDYMHDGVRQYGLPIPTRIWAWARGTSGPGSTPCRRSA